MSQYDQRWRTGRKLGRTIYLQRDPDIPSDDDQLIGIMDTSELAKYVVDCVNTINKINANHDGITWPAGTEET